MTSLSAFEIRGPGFLHRLPPHLEVCGFERLWTSEHHTVNQSASPAVAIAVAATLTQRLNIGSLGVKLLYHSPLRIAKDFHLLEALFPGRIDLGVIGGGGPPKALAYSNSSAESGFEHRALELFRYLREPEATPEGADICRGSSAPRIVIGSISARFAEAAGKAGVGFAYHMMVAGKKGLVEGPEVIRRYRDNFVPTPSMPAPRVVVVSFGACSDSEDDWQLLQHGIQCSSVVDCLAAGAFCGSATDCADQLESLARRLGADEMAVQCEAGSIDGLLNSYSMLADAFALSSAEIGDAREIPRPTTPVTGREAVAH